jgi:hypothetical protein
MCVTLDAIFARNGCNTVFDAVISEIHQYSTVFTNTTEDLKCRLDSEPRVDLSIVRLLKLVIHDTGRIDGTKMTFIRYLDINFRKSIRCSEQLTKR